MVLAVQRQRMGDNVDIDQQAEAARQQTANERAQVEQVFSLTGGELMDVAWVPNYRTSGSALFGSATWGNITFTYWYQGVPEYAVPELSAAAFTCRTVCEQELYGMVPETVTDDEGTWKVVARYSNSGETECPYHAEHVMGVSTDGPCPLCHEAPGSEHDYIYIGDGWAEIVYRLMPPTRQYVATFTLTTDADVNDIATALDFAMGDIYGSELDVTVWERAGFWKDVADGTVTRETNP